MPILQVACPECGAKLSSRAGFTAGQTIKCPKCEDVFALPAARRKPPVELEIDDEDERPTPKKKKPAVVEDDEDDEPRPLKKKKRVVDEDDDEDERPRKKKKGKKSDGEGDYASSPLRFIILGVLVIVMLVLGYFLYRKLTAPPLPDIIVPAKALPGED
jgi:phage FluMu protein Com